MNSVERADNYVSVGKSPLEKFDAFLHAEHLASPKHQREGIVWCAAKEQANNSGGIVADEMGMGKTILMLGLIVSNFTNHTLIIVPKSLLVQWTREVQDKLHHNPFVLYGSNKIKNLTPEILASKHVVITTYGTCVNMGPDSVLHKFRFGRVIVDEAHHLRNNKTMCHTSIDLLQKDVLWLLTGTPIQNNLRDLFNLLKLIKVHYKKDDDLATLLKEHMLMRKKASSAIVLPALSLHECGIKWGSAEEEENSKVFHQRYGTATDKSDTTGLYSGITTNHLVALLHAQMLCIGPKLLKDKMIRYYKETDDAPSEDTSDFFSSTTKMDAVCAKIATNHQSNRFNKKLVFCHFRKEMSIIQEKIESIGGMSVAQYHGGLSSKHRSKLIQRSPDVLILQIRSGCEGLNLQQYNEVYFVSPTWNPSLESQALARCYRMGQQKETHVYRFYMENFEQDELVRSVDGSGDEVAESTISMDERIEICQQGKVKMAAEIDAMCLVNSSR